MNIVIHSNPEGILSIKLPYMDGEGDGENAICDLRSRLCIQPLGPHPMVKVLAGELHDYLRGVRAQFSHYPLVWDGITGFEKKVLLGLGDVPYGRTASYGELAGRIGFPGAARAVGQALKRNPWPVLIPCHRVIGKQGALRGFSSGCGWKRILLRIEKALKEVPG
ncbi:MAG: methylated-DNA--[protein]-cysteine S-methyltransferase [bacterium]